MYKMGKKEIVLSNDAIIGDEYGNTIYNVGKYRIKLFASLTTSISHDTCLKLSKLKTKRIILPSYPVYEDGQYCGCAYENLEDDWIESFYGKGVHLKESLRIMRDEIMLLSNMGYDLNQMLSHKSSGTFSALKFYGTDSIRESDLQPQKLIQKNLAIFHEYLRNLVYNGMSEFGVEADEVLRYIYMEKPITQTLDEALNGDDSAGNLIREDIKRKVR